MKAGEILLGTALIMGLSAIVTILLRMCTRSRLSRERRGMTSFAEAFERSDIRASLTSLQQTIIDKMRDRPPRYETRHNYEYRRREQSQEEENGSREVGIRSISILNPGAQDRTRCEPPPSYETGESSLVHELPPVYSIGQNENRVSFSITNETECPRRQRGSASRIEETPRSDNVLHM